MRRIILDQDYYFLKTWWERRGMPAPSLYLLPEVGVIIEENGMGLSCAFLYEDKSGKIAMVEWEATNPDCTSPMKSIRALHMVFDFFEGYCRERGISIILTYVSEGRGDGRLLEKRKWTKCPGNRHELLVFESIPKEETCPLLSH